jgi:hypothetical protein
MVSTWVERAHPPWREIVAHHPAFWFFVTALFSICSQHWEAERKNETFSFVINKFSGLGGEKGKKFLFVFCSFPGLGNPTNGP